MDRTKRIVGKTIVYGFLCIAGLLTLIPFIWMISTSLKDASEIMIMPPKWIPAKLMWSNYVRAFDVAPFGTYFINTLFITVANTLLTLVTTIFAAFAFSRLKFYGKDLLFSLLLATMMVPGEMLIITNYVTVASIGWVDSYKVLIFPWIASVFYIYLLRQFFMQLPEELYYAAKVDRCSDWKYLWKIMVPNSKHGLITIAIFNAIMSWNAFLWPLLVTNSEEKRVLSIGLVRFKTEAGTEFELLMAASTIIVLPMILLYLFLRKYIMNGVARSGIKG